MKHRIITCTVITFIRRVSRALRLPLNDLITWR